MSSQRIQRKKRGREIERERDRDRIKDRERERERERDREIFQAEKGTGGQRMRDLITMKFVKCKKL